MIDLRHYQTRHRAIGGAPLDYRVKEIYDEVRRLSPQNWWDYYYGSEPYSYLSADRLRRYCTIFEAPGARA